MPNVSETFEEYQRRINTVYSILSNVPNSSIPEAQTRSWYDDPKAGDEYAIVRTWMEQNPQTPPTL